MNVWANAIGYQLVWLAAVGGAASGHVWFAPLALLPFAAWCLGRPDGGADALLMPCVILLGLALDSTLAATGLVAYASPVPFAHAAPLWILVIWAAFALTLRHSFHFLHGRYPLACALGAIGAPMAYLGASRGWHAVTFPHGATVAVMVLALGWSIAMPLMVWLAGRMERTSGRCAPRETAHVA